MPIKLTFTNDGEFYFNPLQIVGYYRIPSDNYTKVMTVNGSYFVNESPDEITARLTDIQACNSTITATIFRNIVAEIFKKTAAPDAESGL